MRKLLWFTIGFLIACGLCVSWLWGWNLALPVFFLLAAGGACTFAGQEKTFAAILSAVLLGGGLGFVWFWFYGTCYLQPILELDGKTVMLSITASDYSERTRYSMEVEGKTVWKGKPYAVLAYLKDNASMEPGDVLDSEFRIRLTIPDGLKASSYYQGDGIFLIATQKGETRITHPEKTGFRHLPVKLAKNIKKVLDSCFPEDTAPFAKALLLGDTTGLTYSEDTVLKLSGIRHIVAVSGLHISLIYGLLIFLFGSRRFLTPAVAIPVLLFFCAMTGFSPSVVRACLMTGLMILGFMLFQEYDSMTSLAFSCIIMLIVNPFVVKSVSFQLSYASVAGILLFASPIYQKIRHRLGTGGKAKKKLANWIAASVSVSASSVLFTTPLSAFYFGTVSLVGIVTNLLTIWVVSVLFCGIAVVAILGSFLPEVCTAAAWLLSWLIRYVLAVAELFSRIPFAAVYTQSKYIVIWLIVCYALFLLYLLMGQKKLRVYCALCVLSLCAAICASVLLPKLDDFRLTVIDVGEGQSILLQSGGQSILIDCGGDSDTGAANEVAQTMLSQGISKLDGVALTHYDRDHSGALENVLTRINVDTFYLPFMGGEEIVDRIELTGEIVHIDQKKVIPFGNGVLTFTEPGKWKTSNENCMCVLFESEKCDILVTGDRSMSGEKRLLRELDLPDVDILIAGHHGSKNSTSYELLQAVSPEIVIISVGKNNSYGHPAQETLDRLAEFGCTVYRTDKDGSVLARR